VSLPRALSKLGVASRSQAIRLIERGAVSVNRKVESNPHRWIDLKRDRIELKDQVPERPAFRYLLLNKPPGVVTTISDERGRKTVFNLLAAKGEGISPVGRLDKESSGLLLFTNDHQFANLLTSPESGIPKTYLASLDRPIGEKDLLGLARGLDIEIKGITHRTKPAQVSQVLPGRVEISITEGKNRQIRRMFGSLGYEVVALQRISVGPLKLGDMREGESRELSIEEVQRLRDAVRPLRSGRKKPGIGRR